MAEIKPFIWRPTTLLPLLLYPGLTLTPTAQSFMIPSLSLFSCTPISMLTPLDTASDSQIHIYSIPSSLLPLPLSILSTHISNMNYFKGLLNRLLSCGLCTTYSPHIHDQVCVSNAVSRSCVNYSGYSPFIPREGKSQNPNDPVFTQKLPSFIFYDSISRASISAKLFLYLLSTGDIIHASIQGVPALSE
jgi:hypothetical protein